MKQEHFDDTLDYLSEKGSWLARMSAEIKEQDIEQKEAIQEAFILLSQVLEYDSMDDVNLHRRWVEEFVQRNSQV